MGYYVKYNLHNSSFFFSKNVMLYKDTFTGHIIYCLNSGYQDPQQKYLHIHIYTHT